MSDEIALICIRCFEDIDRGYLCKNCEEEISYDDEDR